MPGCHHLAFWNNGLKMSARVIQRQKNVFECHFIIYIYHSSWLKDLKHFFLNIYIAAHGFLTQVTWMEKVMELHGLSWKWQQIVRLPEIIQKMNRLHYLRCLLIMPMCFLIKMSNDIQWVLRLKNLPKKSTSNRSCQERSGSAHFLEDRTVIGCAKLTIWSVWSMMGSTSQSAPPVDKEHEKGVFRVCIPTWKYVLTGSALLTD